MKAVGGASSDEWNSYLFGKLMAALPNGLTADRRQDLMQSMVGGLTAIKPDDPIEAMLAGQILAANEAACDMYRRAWIADQSFDVRTKYLALADKAARTIAVLTEALDRHRSRGQQQITVRHVTVHANQAVVADQIMTAPKDLVGEGVYGQTKGRPHAIADTSSATLYCDVQEVGTAVPSPSR